MKIALLILLFFCFQFIYSQEDNSEKISILFENSSKINVIKHIEELSDYHFYFVKNWLDDELISGNYKDVSIKTLLNAIFKNTVINYYITPDNKVILTRSVLIHNSLPDGFFGKKNIRAETVEPMIFTKKVFKQKYNIETIRIGKESKNSRLKSYTLKGFVRYLINDKPIPNLVITVQNKNINAVTDKNGFYSIDIPRGLNIIETKSIGIQSAKKKVIIYKNGTLNINLKESLENLKEVIIEGSRDKNVENAITGITQIKMEAIKNIPLVLGERDILKVATSLPGISNAGEGSSGFNVRGGKEDQNLILLDNGVIYNPSHFFGIFSALNPFATGDVNIYKGAIPSEYGGRLSSVFDIKTKNSNTEKFSGEASLGPVTSNLLLDIPIIKKKSGLLIGGRGTYSDWILKSLDDKSLNNSKASFYDVVVKYNQNLDDNNNIQTTGYFSEDAFSITSDSIYSYNNSVMSLKWNHIFNKKNSGNLIFTNSEYKFNIGFEGNSNINFNLGYKVNETQLKLKMKYLFNKKHKFDYGISSKLYVVHPGFKEPKGLKSIIENIKIPKEKALESAIFISDNFKLNEKLLLNLGFRYSLYNTISENSKKIDVTGLAKNQKNSINTLNFDKNKINKVYGGPEARVSFRYFLSQDFSVKAGYNSMYQYIHSLSNNTTVSTTDTWKLSDFNIKPQQANLYSLGLYKNLEGNRYELSLEGYYKRSTNVLDYKVGADLLLNKSIESEVLQGEGKAYGVELLIKKTKGKLNGWIGYTYSRSFYKFDGELSEERINNGEFFPSNYDKPHDVSIVANFKITKRFSFSSNFIYQSGKPVTYPIGNYNYNGAEYVLYSNRNEFRIPDYYRLDLGFNMEGNHKIKKLAHSFWNLSIYNVLGRNNPYSVFFVTENGKIKAYKSSIFSIPVPTITYNIKF